MKRIYNTYYLKKKFFFCDQESKMMIIIAIKVNATVLNKPNLPYIIFAKSMTKFIKSHHTKNCNDIFNKKQIIWHLSFKREKKTFVKVI